MSLFNLADFFPNLADFFLTNAVLNAGAIVALFSYTKWINIQPIE